MYKEILRKLAYQPQIRKFVTTSRLTRPLVRRFVAGESIDQATSASRGLNNAGKSVSLDFVGEEVDDLESADSCVSEYLDLLNAIKKEGLDANISLKLTSLGLSLGGNFCEANLRRIVDHASEQETFVTVDMESSAYTRRTLDIFNLPFPNFNNKNLGAVTQANLLRSNKDTHILTRHGFRIRLCKGAYAEPAGVAFQDKKDVDENYKKIMDYLLTYGNFPGIATHDENMINYAKVFSKDFFIDPGRFEFQMLFGVRRDLQDKLVRSGWNMRVYLPYGKDWYPYLIRRLLERPANMLFVLNSIRKEAVAA